MRRTADAFQVPRGTLAAGRRTRYRTQARWAAAYLLRRSGQFSYSDIARLLLYKDHTSARSGVLAFRRRLAADPYLHDTIEALAVQLHLPPDRGEWKGGIP